MMRINIRGKINGKPLAVSLSLGGPALTPWGRGSSDGQKSLSMGLIGKIRSAHSWWIETERATRIGSLRGSPKLELLRCRTPWGWDIARARSLPV